MRRRSRYLAAAASGFIGGMCGLPPWQWVVVVVPYAIALGVSER